LKLVYASNKYLVEVLKESMFRKIKEIARILSDLRSMRSIQSKLYRRIPIILSTLIFIISGIHASSTKIHLDLDGVMYDQGQARVAVGEVFQINVIVENGDRDTGEVEIDGIENLDVHGTSQSSSISLNNSQFISQNTNIYDVSVPREGEFILGPAHTFF